MLNKALLLVVVGLVSAVSYFTYRYYHPYPNWPFDAKKEALPAMTSAMQTHDCSPEMEVWNRTSEPEGEYLYQQENEICRQSYEHSGWLVSDAVVRAIFRCDLGDRFGEYSMTIFRDVDTISGPSWCEYIVKRRDEDLGLGKNLSFTQPHPRVGISAYDNTNTVFIPIETSE